MRRSVVVGGSVVVDGPVGGTVLVAVYPGPVIRPGVRILDRGGRPLVSEGESRQRGNGGWWMVGQVELLDEQQYELDEAVC